MPTTATAYEESQSCSCPIVSVIVPARNEEKYLAACLAAINAQDFSDEYEVIVVDNDSTDATADIAAGAGARVIFEPEPGLPRARETGRQAARAPLLIYIDADTHIPSDYLRSVVDTFQREPRVQSVTSPVRFYDGDWSANLFIFCYFHIYRLLNLLRLCDFIFGGTFALRSEVIERVGGFDVSIAFYGEDADLTKRIAREGVIRYLGNLFSLTSARRYQREGTFLTVMRYAINYYSVLFCNRPFKASQRRAQALLRYGTIMFLMCSLFLYAFAFPESELFGKVIYRVNSPDKVVALTFDDGPGVTTRAILRVLADEGVKATFFLTGDNVDHAPALAAEIVHAGHAVGNYSYHHSWSLSFQRRSTVLDEVRQADAAIYRATHVHTHLFRPPHGLRTPWMLSAIHDEGYAVIMWDDTTNAFLSKHDPQLLAQHILQKVHPDSIIAMHDEARQPEDATANDTAEALRIIIHELKHQHYRFVMLDETTR